MSDESELINRANSADRVMRCLSFWRIGSKVSGKTMCKIRCLSRPPVFWLLTSSWLSKRRENRNSLKAHGSSRGGPFHSVPDPSTVRLTQ